MFATQKYIRTANDEIIMFPEIKKHSDFKHLNPLSAGFVRFKTTFEEKEGCIITAECYGESDSLGLKSTSEIDNKIINAQFFI